MVSPRRRRRGMASLEVVLATAIFFPAAGALMFLGFRGCAHLFQVIANLVGWPHL